MTRISSKLRAALLASVLVASSVWLYTTPTGQSVRSSLHVSLPSALLDALPSRIVPKAEKAPEKTGTGRAGSAVRAVADPVAEQADSSEDSRTVAPPAQDDYPVPSPDPVVPVPTPAPPSDPVVPAPTPAPPSDPVVPVPTPAPPSDPPTERPPKIEGCWSFAWQQDAQAYYDADPTDPVGLDGPRGPRNGDGIACGHLPVDPNRPVSIPVWPWEPAVPAKAELLSTSGRFFGVAEDGIPGDTRLLDTLSTQVGKAPSMIEWFATWDEDYNARKVDLSWRRGALPVITWMPAHKGNTRPEDTSQDRILDGEWDDYIRTYATALRTDAKPVVMRFAHEQNGNWYPWSAGGNRAFYNGTRGEPYFNTPEKFIAMWRHVWQIFEDEGANDYAIWAWTPVNSDAVKANTTDISKTSFGLTDIEDSYPGDGYVDWVGMSGYAYQNGSWSYTKSFAGTFNRLKALAPQKRILVAETGAAENTGAASNTEKKAAWIAETLRGFVQDSALIGFVWFNNTVVDVHTVDGVRVTTDNKWDTSPQSLAAFVDGIADPVWLTGQAPDIQ